MPTSREDGTPRKVLPPERRRLLITLIVLIGAACVAGVAYIVRGSAHGSVGWLWRHDRATFWDTAAALWWLWLILAVPAAACVWFLIRVFRRRRIW